MDRVTRAIDTFVNVNMGAVGRPDYLVRVAEDYFKRGEAIFKSYSVAELTDVMDQAGITKAVVTVNAKDTAVLLTPASRATSAMRGRWVPCSTRIRLLHPRRLPAAAPPT